MVKYLITSFSNTGAAALKSLLALGEKDVIVGARNVKESSAKILAAGAKRVVELDLEKPETLVTALKGDEASVTPQLLTRPLPGCPPSRRSSSTWSICFQNNILGRYIKSLFFWAGVSRHQVQRSCSPSHDAPCSSAGVDRALLSVGMPNELDKMIECAKNFVAAAKVPSSSTSPSDALSIRDLLLAGEPSEARGAHLCHRCQSERSWSRRH